HQAAELAQRAVGSEAGARQRRRLLGRHVAEVEQIARMRHQHMVAVAARTEHPDEARPQAELLVAANAYLAFAAADPWVDQAALRIGRRRSSSCDLHLVTMGSRERSKRPQRTESGRLHTSLTGCGRAAAGPGTSVPGAAYHHIAAPVAAGVSSWSLGVRSSE